jgi:predicted DNA-binding transcriptional regulator AlpA
MAKQPNPVRDEDAAADDAFVGLDAIARRLGLSHRTVRRMIERGELPKPCLGAAGRPRWLWSFVVEYCHKRHQRDEELDRRRNRKLN